MNVIPMVKHTAGDGFIPVIHTASSIIPYIHVLLPDAKVTYDAAQAHFQANNLPQALECIQESTSLYQKVVESVLHISICKCLTLFAIILYQVNEVELALKNSCRAMAIAVQIGGFDCSEAVTAHSTLSHILINVGNIASGVQHIRASIYLMELMAGPRYIEISNSYHKLGTLYYDIGNLMNGLRFYQESAIRTNRDRVMEGIFWRKTACVLTALNHFKRAFDAEKRAYMIFRSILGEEDEHTKGSLLTLKYLMRKAIEQSIQAVDDERKKNGKVVDIENTDKTILNLTETKVLCNKDNDSRKQQRKRRKKKTKKK
jgi:tetratricopeptide (TPR) repeat protein